MRTSIAAKAFGLALCLSASAAAADITVFKADELAAIVTANGATNVTQEQADGTTFVNFELNGRNYSLSLRLCDMPGQPGCVGVLMATGYQVEKMYSLETFNNFNRSVPVATVVMLDSNLMAFGRLMTSLGGVTRGNIEANLGLVVAAPDLFAQHLKGQVVASTSLGGQARMMPLSSTPEQTPAPVRLSPHDLERMVDDTALVKMKLR